MLVILVIHRVEEAVICLWRKGRTPTLLFYFCKYGCSLTAGEYGKCYNSHVRKFQVAVDAKLLMQRRQDINTVEPCYNRDHGTKENYLIISGFLLYEGEKTKKYKELGAAKLPWYKSGLYPSSLYNKVPLYNICSGGNNANANPNLKPSPTPNGKMQITLGLTLCHWRY